MPDSTTEDTQRAEQNAKATEGKDESSAGSYTSRLVDISKWAVGALAAVGTAAVTKLSLDRLGKGDLDRPLVAWAFAGLGAFVLGTVLLVIAVVWHTRAARVTIGYLLEDGRIPSRIRTFFNTNTYFLGGASSLEDFRHRLNGLVGKSRPLSAADRRDFRRLLAARDGILGTGRSERTRIVSARAAWVLFLGALLASLGAATFALATNRDLVLREDRLAQEERDREEVVTGELLSKTPSSVLLVVPEEDRSQSLRNSLGEACDPAGVKAILLEIGAPPVRALTSIGEVTNVFHVVTERTGSCAVVDLWVPSHWVLPRPESDGADEPTANATPAGAATKAGATGSETSGETGG